MRREDEDTQAALRKVKTVYAALAERKIERQCTLLTECCQFKLTGLVPYLTKGEALVAAKAFRASGRRKLVERADGACPLLDPATSRCMIYEGRPFGCRTHFCQAAGGPYARAEVADLIHQLEKVDADLGGKGASSLPVAVRDALRELS